MTDEQIFNNWIATHPVRVYAPKPGREYDPIAAATFVGTYTEQRQFTDAFNATPDGEFKYNLAIKLTAPNAKYDYPEGIRAVTMMSSEDLRNPISVMLHNYYRKLEYFAQYFLAYGDGAEYVIDAYNKGQTFGKLFTKAFEAYGVPRGQFTKEAARVTFDWWKSKREPSLFEKAFRVVVPAFIAIVGGIAVAGAISGGAAASGATGTTATAGTAGAAGTTAAVTPGITVLGVDTGISLGSAALNSMAGTVASGAVTGGAQSLVSGGSASDGAQAGAQSAATGAVVEGVQGLEIDLPQIDLGDSIQLENPFSGYGGVANPFAGVGQISVGNIPLPGQQMPLVTVPAPPVAVVPVAAQEPEKPNSIDWEKLAKVALPAISILLLLSGR